MIIAISAAPRVDTMTEASLLARKFGLPLHEDPMRDACREYGFQTIYNMPSDLQAQVRERLVHEHLEFVTRTNDLLLNYSVVGWLADWMRWFWNNTPTRSWERILDVSRECVARYDAIHHVESGPERLFDGYFWLDRENSVQIARILAFLYQELGIEGKVRNITV